MDFNFSPFNQNRAYIMLVITMTLKNPSLLLFSSRFLSQPVFDIVKFRECRNFNETQPGCCV